MVPTSASYLSLVLLVGWWLGSVLIFFFLSLLLYLIDICWKLDSLSRSVMTQVNDCCAWKCFFLLLDINGGIWINLGGSWTSAFSAPQALNFSRISSVYCLREGRFSSFFFCFSHMAPHLSSLTYFTSCFNSKVIYSVKPFLNPSGKFKYCYHSLNWKSVLIVHFYNFTLPLNCMLILT